jgi:hypothetical protein
MIRKERMKKMRQEKVDCAVMVRVTRQERNRIDQVAAQLDLRNAAVARVALLRGLDAISSNGIELKK